jgi:alkyl sulfatase BDS1-like metallo-beta-lactamase superfamily hydrolase
LDHALFAEPDHAGARALQADTFEQLAYGPENGTWRSVYLAGAKELREGQFGTPVAAASADLLRALTVPQIFDSVAVRVYGPRAWDRHITIAWVFTDEDAIHVTELRNGALNHRPVAAAPPGITTFRLTRPGLAGSSRGARTCQPPSPTERSTSREIPRTSPCSSPYWRRSTLTLRSLHPELRRHRGDPR